MTRWTLCPDSSNELKKCFGSIDRVFALTGKHITGDRLSDVIYLEIGDEGYYIKRYHSPGKGVRRFLGRSRIRGEWENLQYFNEWGIPAAQLLAFGIEKRGPFFKRGAIVTREIPNTKDLAQLAKHNDPRLKNPEWVQAVSRQLAHAARTMHHHKFAHGDLKWRNILVTSDPSPKIYLIDCPAGAFWPEALFKRRLIKDLACLDKVAKNVLTQTQRLRFFLDYLDVSRLDRNRKKQVFQVLQFFNGRE